MSNQPVPRPNIAVDRTETGWRYAYNPTTRIVALVDAGGRWRQTIAKIETDQATDQYGEFIAAMLNGTPPQ